MSRWFRFYGDALNDRKVQSLPPELFKAWVNLLCLACNENGKAFDLAQVAFALRLADSKAQSVVGDLLSRGLLDDTAAGLVPHNWNSRQYKSDTSNDRVAKYRETRRNGGLKTVSDYSQYRAALIKRDGERCVYCSATTGLVVDHMVPIKLGGTDDLDNLALACRSCNSGKAGRTPELAGLKIRVISAENALSRYRDSRAVTVTITPPDTEQKDSEANASDAGASPRDRLWKEGLPALVALGVREKQARPMVGRWLKDCGDDEARLLDLILRARAECPVEPIAWITAALTKGKKHGTTENLSTVARRLAEQVVDFGPRPGSAGAVRNEENSDAVRMLSQGGRK